MTSTTTDTTTDTTPRPRRESCSQCGTRHIAADAYAVGLLSLPAPLYRAASAPIAGLRATRAQAIEDECAARQAAHAEAAQGSTASALTFAQRDTLPGQYAQALAHCLRSRQVPRPLAAALGGDDVGVVIAWPSGNDRVVIGVDVSDGRPTFRVAAYEDGEHQPPGHEHTAHDIPTVVADVRRLLTTDTPPAPQHTAQPVTAGQDAAPWIAPDGLTVQVHHGDDTTTTAPVVALIDRDEVAGTVRVQTLTTTLGLAIVRRTHRSLDGQTRTTVHVEPHGPEHEGPGPWIGRGTTVTGHEPTTGITGPLGLLIPRR